MANAYGRIAALRPADTSEAELYAPGAGEEAIVTLYVCNQDSSDRTFRVALTDASGAATGEDWLYYDQTVWANMSFSLRAIALTYGQTIRVQASIADKISFVLSGLVIT